MRLLQRLILEEAGQSLVEYGLLVGFVSLGVVASMVFMGAALRNGFSTAAAQLSTTT